MTQEEYLQKMSALDYELLTERRRHRETMIEIETNLREWISLELQGVAEAKLDEKRAYDEAVAGIEAERRKLRADWIAEQNAAALQAEHCDVGGIGLFEALSRNLEPHQMRQVMTETFYNWMNDWMHLADGATPLASPDARFDTPFVRSEMMESYRAVCSPRERVCVTPQRFWLCLMLWCRYHGLALNPHMPLNFEGRPTLDIRDGGTEYITIGTSRVENTNL